MIDREKFCRFYADIDPEIGGGYKWSVRSNGFPVWSVLRLGCRIMLIRRFKFRLDIDVCLLSHFLACYFSTSRPHTTGLDSSADLSLFFARWYEVETNKRFFHRIIFYSRWQYLGFVVVVNFNLSLFFLYRVHARILSLVIDNVELVSGISLRHSFLSLSRTKLAPSSSQSFPFECFPRANKSNETFVHVENRAQDPRWFLAKKYNLSGCRPRIKCTGRGGIK